jgi:hypothetical protein
MFFPPIVVNGAGAGDGPIMIGRVTSFAVTGVTALTFRFRPAMAGRTGASGMPGILT